MTGLPITERGDLVRSQAAAVPLPGGAANGVAYVRAGVTGTGDDLLVLRWTAADLARERAAGARVLGGFGIRAGMRVANTLAGALVTPGSLLIGDVIDEMGCLDVPLGFTANEAGAKAAWELIDRVQPQVLILDKGSAPALLAAAAAQDRPWLLGIVWLQTASAGDPRCDLPAALGFSGWQRTWLAVPEVSSFVAGQCGASNWHVDEGVEAEIVGEQLVLTPRDADSGLRRFASAVAARELPGCDCQGAGIVLRIL